MNSTHLMDEQEGERRGEDLPKRRYHNIINTDLERKIHFSEFNEGLNKINT